ncbi:hypothetical protein HMPREF9096_00405 [Haemophilus sp. oral taxon 851 str. F0397]|nr:hypothetical protein HMPREF9096_00405 [Haemophilus sp. oral taxon 851 str. F0397]
MQRHPSRIKLKKDRQLSIGRFLFDMTKVLKCGQFSHSFT